MTIEATSYATITVSPTDLAVNAATAVSDSVCWSVNATTCAVAPVAFAERPAVLLLMMIAAVYC